MLALIVVLLVIFMWLGLGILPFWLKIKGSKISKMYLFLGTLSLLFGCIGVVGLFLQKEELQVVGVLFPIVILMCLYPLILTVRMWSCRERVSAKCVDYSVMKFRGGVAWYSPIFKYTYKKKKYEVCSSLHYGKWRVMRKYKIKNQCKVYINPKDPSVCYETKFMPFADCMIGVLGWFMLYVLVKAVIPCM